MSRPNQPLTVPSPFVGMTSAFADKVLAWATPSYHQLQYMYLGMVLANRTLSQLRYLLIDFITSHP